MILRSTLTALALLIAAPALSQDAAPADAEQAQPELLPDVFLGDADAPLTIYEYASFTCGHCAHFHEEVLPELKADYIDTGKVRFAQRDVYFEAVGLWAGILARCGGDDKYYAISNLLFDEQRDWMTAKSGDEIAANLRKLGLKAGMTEEQMTACWDDRAQAEALVATFQQNATKDDVQATPTLIIGGDKVQNQPWDKLKEIIDAKLAELDAPAE